MKSWVLAAVIGSCGLVVACSSDNNNGGAGGSAGAGAGGSGVVSSSHSSSSHSSSATGMVTSTGVGGGSGTCDSIGVCQDPTSPGDTNYDNDCISCMIAGTTHSDGSSCQSDYVACFGTDTMCTGGNMACCALANCIQACPTDAMGNPTLSCICTSTDGMTCDQTQTDPMTCFGANQAGIMPYETVLQCVFSGCQTSCM